MLDSAHASDPTMRHASAVFADRVPLLPMRARGLSYEVQGRRLVDCIDLDIDASGITMVMGPNGAGKSLLLRLLHGLISPSAGTVTWAGLRLDDDLRRRQAMVFQKPVLLRRSAAANIGFVLGLRGRREQGLTERLLADVGLSGRGAQPARLLSGGEQQRLALARALATRPEVLFLDEPTASLDPASTAQFEAIVGGVAKAGTKVIFITHDIGQARRLAGDVVFLRQGRVAEHAPADRFFTDPTSSAARDFLAGRLVL